MRQTEAQVSSSALVIKPLFNDHSSSDIVLILQNQAEPSGANATTSSLLELSLHQVVLTANSPWFARMLANKDKSVGRAWRDDTSGGAADILDEQLGDVGIPQDCATALKKLYDKTSEDPLKCPVPSFSCFEEALRCLKPAHRLELSSVCSSAVGYLESIAWSQSQEEALFAVLSQIEPSSMVDRLWARFEPSSKNSQAAMLDDILQRATLAEDEMGRNMARSYFQKLVASNVGKPEAADIVPALRRILTQLDGLNLEGFSERPFSYAVPNGGLAIGNRKYATDPLLSSLVSSLAWVFQLPNLAADTNVKHDVLRLTASLPSKIGQELYKWQIFHRYIAEQLFLPIAGAIAGGELVVGADTRAQLLGLWVPQKYALYPGESIPYPHSDTMQAAFLAVLSTVQIDEQAQILRPWRDDLMGSNEAWYEEWLDGFFGATNQRRLVARGSEPASRVGPTSTVARGLLSGSPVCPRIAAVPRLAERRATSHIYDFKKDAGDSLSFRSVQFALLFTKDCSVCM